MVSKGRDPRPPPRFKRPRLSSVRDATRRVSDFSRRSFGSSGVSSGLARMRPRPRPRRETMDFAAPPVGGAGTSSGGGGKMDCLSCLSACCCCCSCCCCCLNLEYARTRPGMLRVAELALSWLCNWLLGRYALRVAGMLGGAMPAFFLTAAGGAICCSLLLAVALLSERSLGLLRASLFEISFHATAVALYSSQASYLHVATTMYLEPYKNDMESYTYPAVVTSYWLGYFLAALHSLDAVYSLKHYRQYRT